MWSLIPHKPVAAKTSEGWVCSRCGKRVKFVTRKFSHPSYNHPQHA